MTHQFKTSISQIKIGQIAMWLKLLEGFDDRKFTALLQNLEFRTQVVAIMLEMPMSQARRIDVDDVLQISNHYITLLSTYKYKEPRELIEVKGQKFKFTPNFGAWSTGQIIDAKLLDVESLYTHPERLVAIMYVEQGLRYHEEDAHQQVINPNERREKIFAEYFDGEEFWNFYNFFLSNYEDWKLAISGIQIARMRIAAKTTEKLLKKRQRAMKMRGIISRLRLSWSRKS